MRLLNLFTDCFVLELRGNALREHGQRITMFQARASQPLLAHGTLKSYRSY